MKKIVIILITLSTLIHAKMQVCVSILPQAFFVQKIAGDLVDIEVLVKPGASPATYAPKPSQLKRISDASIYFTIGVAFEKNWLPRFGSINDKMKLIDTTKEIEKISMLQHAHKHDEHSHKGLDPHVWLDPILVASQVKIITQTLVKEDSKNSKIYQKNEQKFTKELKEIDTKIKKIISNVKQKEFIVFHPSFGYFAKRYGLEQVAIEKEGKEPSVKYIKKVIDFAKEHQIKRVFVAPQFSQKSAKQIAKQIGGSVQSINPLAKKWDENILNIAKSFETK
jgi:zinc transport system substrate-binding protein